MANRQVNDANKGMRKLILSLITVISILAILTVYFEFAAVNSYERYTPLAQSVSTVPQRDTMENRYVNVVFSTDARTVIGLLAAMRSVIVNARRPSSLRFFIVTVPDNVHETREGVYCLMSNFNLSESNKTSLGESIHSYHVIPFDIYEFAPDWKIKYREPKHDSDRSSTTNYARLFLRSLLRKTLKEHDIPNKIVYLDTDIIVQGDVGELYWRYLNSDSGSAVAIARRARTLSQYTIRFDHPALDEWNRRYANTSKQISPDWRAYNNGVCVMNLYLWEKFNISSEIQHWVCANMEQQLYDMSLNPPFLLGVRNRIDDIDAEWNLDSLGSTFVKRNKTQIKQAKILHWTGKHKPTVPINVSLADNSNLVKMEGRCEVVRVVELFLQCNVFTSSQKIVK